MGLPSTTSLSGRAMTSTEMEQEFNGKTTGGVLPNVRVKSKPRLSLFLPAWVSKLSEHPTRMLTARDVVITSLKACIFVLGREPHCTLQWLVLRHLVESTIYFVITGYRSDARRMGLPKCGRRFWVATQTVCPSQMVIYNGVTSGLAEYAEVLLYVYLTANYQGIRWLLVHDGPFFRPPSPVRERSGAVARLCGPHCRTLNLP